MQLLRAAAVQCLAAVTVWRFGQSWHWPFGQLLALQCLIAACLSRLIGQPSWWLPIHLAFLPCVFLIAQLQIPAHWFLVVFLLLVLIFWGTVKGDVPLFMSSVAVADAVADIVAAERASNVCDLGAGIGSIAVRLARLPMPLRVVAWEHAPLPWLILVLRCLRLAHVHVSKQSFWSADLSQYDVVFAFLSPPIMPRLANKLVQEMRSGSLFVSSSFPIPDWRPDFVRQIDDRRQTLLYAYRMPGTGSVEHCDASST